MEAEIVDKDKVNFEVNPDRIAIQNRLAQLRVGETVRYDELSSLIGSNIRERRHVLDSARRWLLNNKQMVFGAVTGEGVQRLDDEQIAALPEREAKSARRRMTRVLKKVACIQEFDSLPREIQDSHNVGVAYLAAYRRFSSTKQFEKVRQACVQAKAALPSGKMLEIFR